MNREDIKAEGHCEAVPIRDGFWACVPGPLPPDIEFGRSLTMKNSEADRALGLLAGHAARLPNPHLLIHPFIRTEAVLSSRIEGTQASLSDLFWFEAKATRNEKTQGDVQEVANYVTALEYGLARMTKFPVSLRLLREMHRILLQGVRGQEHSPGQFRQSQNWIGPPGQPLEEAAYVPPPPHLMMECLDNFEKYLHQEADLPPIIRLAAIHYQFEAIHPFRDGNGRIGRLMLILLLCHDRMLPQPLLYLSAYFERNRSQYYDLLLAVSQQGSWNAWIEFFLDGVVQQATDAINRSQELLQLRAEYRNELQGKRAPSALLELVDQLFRYPIITASGAHEILGCAERTVYNYIDRLEAENILEETTGQERNRVYVARDIIDCISGAEAD